MVTLNTTLSQRQLCVIGALRSLTHTLTRVHTHTQRQSALAATLRSVLMLTHSFCGVVRVLHLSLSLSSPRVCCVRVRVCKTNTHTHTRESGYIAELAQMEAMRLRQTIWIDGTLKDTDYYTKVFQSYRQTFPHYKIAIFKISSPEHVLRARVHQRSVATGRRVPEEVIRAGVESVDHSLRVLMPYVQYVCEVMNATDGSAPVLEQCVVVDRSGEWGNLKRFGDAV